MDPPCSCLPTISATYLHHCSPIAQSHQQQHNVITALLTGDTEPSFFSLDICMIMSAAVISIISIPATNMSELWQGNSRDSKIQSSRLVSDWSLQYIRGGQKVIDWIWTGVFNRKEWTNLKPINNFNWARNVTSLQASKLRQFKQEEWHFLAVEHWCSASCCTCGPSVKYFC